MCTLTFYPNATGFVLTSSRDERVDRATIPPQEYTIGGKEYVFPKDVLSGGTWLSTSGNRSYCLLNGAFKAHQKTANYRISRGSLIMQAMLVDDSIDFCINVPLDEIEPFTLIMMDHGNEIRLQSLVWDGEEKFINEPDPMKPHIWSSATLYNERVRNLRKQWFDNFLRQNPTATASDLWHFHFDRHTKHLSENILMKRSGGIQTTAVSQIKKSHQVDFKFHDLLSDSISNFSLNKLESITDRI